ncbi:putative pleckstrin homology domain [Lyophyllum shimeji]|uniref:Pleckstrin homology domain n=1 Tax=Lyophyllum shimeji TaxID=47721 RepID=A0A9P3UNT4_LYOSH|nr:putative pleckstrin homology domain [Lyophyllum shimeji]
MAQTPPWSSRRIESVLDSPTSFTTIADAAQLLLPPHILVRDPPRDQLPAEPGQNSVYLLASYPAQGNGRSTTGLYITRPEQSPTFLEEPNSLVSKSPRRQRVRMAKKRRSMQSMLIPSFLNAPLSSSDSPTPSRTRSHSTASQSEYPHVLDSLPPSSFNTSRVSTPRESPPPDFLLDDDPFANLSAIPATSAHQPATTPAPALIPTASLDALPPKPRSPLTPKTPETKPSFLASPPPISARPVPGVSRTLSGRARPAYQKPAFAPRPSLPSLDTLARMNVVLTRKVRKGRVGARLPFEPWDQLDQEQTSGESSTSDSQASSLLNSPVTALSDPPDFVADLELDFLDFSDNEDTAQSRAARSSIFGEELVTSPISQDEPAYNADWETSMNEASVHYLSRTPSETLSEMSSLTRSTSMSSTSSNGPHHDYQSPSFGSHDTSMSSAEDSDTLNSPPDDDVGFDSSHFDSRNIISSYWTSEDLFDSLNGDSTGSALYSDANLLGESDDAYEPGTSAGTIRPSVEPKVLPSSPLQVTESSMYQGEALDGAGRESQRGQGGLGRGWEQGGGASSRADGYNAGGGNGEATGSGTNLPGGGRGDDEDEDDKRVNRSTFSTPSDSEATTTDEESASDDYGKPARTQSRVMAESSAASSDDDVPLAQRIPTALRAQNTIRRQVREERQQRRVARAAARAEQSASASRGQAILRPPGVGEPSRAAQMSSSAEAALHAARSMRRPRTKTLPNSEMQPFSPDDLARKLQSAQVADVPEPPPSHLRPRSKTTSRRDLNERFGSRTASDGRGLRDAEKSQPFTSPPQSPPPEYRSLRPMRSFHRSQGRTTEEHHAVPLPLLVDASQKFGRSLTRRDGSAPSPRSYPPRISQDEASPRPLVRKSVEEPRKVTKAYSETRGTRSSGEADRPRPSAQRPPVPPLPASEALPVSPHNTRGPLIQQRVFIGDMQRFNMVEIGPSTNAGDVIEMVEAQGSLKGWVGSGDWMVWEIAQDFGMERPIRSFELLSDVQASWNKDKMMNTFVIRLTPLAAPLSRSALPSASPTHAGYVDWESKRGKWNKRWLQLREHSLWLSKRDNGRDEVLLCSLSNFDAYFITRLHKAPRPFSFAVKSTDNLSFFENTADYLHIFSCGEKEGHAWMEKILLARSYVLHQERNVLFNPKAASGNGAGGSTSLSRAGTRKGPSSRPAQPLVSVGPPAHIAQQMQSGDVFEPGSLLRKHA